MPITPTAINAAWRTASAGAPLDISTIPDAARYVLSQTRATVRGGTDMLRVSECGRSAPSVTLAGVSVEIISVESSRELRRFIDLPWKIYNRADHPQWVPPLR